MRMGDGWGADAYLARQPFFREYPRLLILRNRRALHRHLPVPARRGGERGRRDEAPQPGDPRRGRGTTAVEVPERSRRRSGTPTATTSRKPNHPRFTFGELRIDGTGGHLTMDASSTIRVKRLGAAGDRAGLPARAQELRRRLRVLPAAAFRRLHAVRPGVRNQRRGLPEERAHRRGGLRVGANREIPSASSEASSRSPRRGARGARYGSQNVFATAALPALYPLRSVAQTRRTEVTIRGDAFLINGRPTYAGRTFNGKRIEGLLMNVRVVQGIFDDLNPETAPRWVYPDTKRWDPDRNTSEFTAAMAEWKRHGVLAFTINLQGGSPGFAGGRGRGAAAAGAGAAPAPGRGGTRTSGRRAAGKEALATRRRRAVDAAAADAARRVRNSRTPRSIPTAICGPPTWRGCRGSSTRPTSSGWSRSSATSTSGRTSG